MVVTTVSMSCAAKGAPAVSSIAKRIAGKNRLRIACIVDPRAETRKRISSPAGILAETPSVHRVFVVHFSIKSQSQSTPIPGDSGGWAKPSASM